jgi:hypothetical protein
VYSIYCTNPRALLCQVMYDVAKTYRLDPYESFWDEDLGASLNSIVIPMLKKSTTGQLLSLPPLLFPASSSLLFPVSSSLSSPLFPPYICYLINFQPSAYDLLTWFLVVFLTVYFDRLLMISASAENERTWKLRGSNKGRKGRMGS